MHSVSVSFSTNSALEGRPIVDEAGHAVFRTALAYRRGADFKGFDHGDILWQNDDMGEIEMGS